jgi:predicted P-loop ATPase
MDAIAQTLLDAGCAVSMIPLPAVGSLPDGWDCADAIDADGWDLARVLAFVAGAKVLVREAGLTRVVKLDEGFAAALPPELAWTQFLQMSKDGNIKPTRENVAAALRNDAAFAGAVKYNLFSNRVDVLRDLPWRPRGVGKAKMSEWVDFDSLHLGDYLCKTHFFPSAGSATLHEAVGLAASVNSYHPVRDGLERIQWDGTARLNDWLIRAVCASPDTLDPKMREYISLVGRFFIMGAVARVTDPGCKFDYCFVLKGDQGAGKSTLFSVLGGAYFSDNKFKLDDAANMGLALAGRWFVEFAELASLNRSEVNDVKSCITQQVDRYRPPFGKVVTDHPRQCVFCGSTNDDTPLRDPTGARRFWVVEVTKPLIDNDYVRSVRLQLFAEALVAVKSGERHYPSYEQESVLFKPEQERHTRSSPIYEQLLHLAGNEVGDWASKSEWTTAEIGMKLTSKGVDAVTPTLQQEIGSAMRRMGWSVQQKRVAGKVVRVYKKPDNWYAIVNERSTDSESQKSSTGVSPTSSNPVYGDDDDIPF